MNGCMHTRRCIEHKIVQPLLPALEELFFLEKQHIKDNYQAPKEEEEEEKGETHTSEPGARTVSNQIVSVISWSDEKMCSNSRKRGRGNPAFAWTFDWRIQHLMAKSAVASMAVDYAGVIIRERVMQRADDAKERQQQKKEGQEEDQADEQEEEPILSEEEINALSETLAVLIRSLSITNSIGCSLVNIFFTYDPLDGQIRMVTDLQREVSFGTGMCVCLHGPDLFCKTSSCRAWT